ncbi:MAG TPA: hypothetical protein VJB16_05535 [archaeon]|nr:hypothetical protein [archaeon]
MPSRKINDAEPELRPEFIKRIQRRLKEKAIPIDDFATRFGITKKRNDHALYL